ncbi:MAG: hypothetical protein WAO09_01525 [Candidatus Dormiibacterota bacterium]
MRRPNLADARQKLRRADHYVEVLHEVLEVWNGAEDDAVIVQRWKDEPELQYTSVYVERLKPIPEAWGLIVGDALNNYRSCLDHLAYALVRCGAASSSLRSEKFCIKVEFPMDRGAFSVRRRLPGVDNRYIEALAPFQPGKRPGTRRWQLGALRRLNNVDKHRKLLMTHHALGFTELRSGTPAPVRVEPLPGALYPKPNTELVRLHWRYGRPPRPVKYLNSGINFENPSMDVQFEPTCTIVFRQNLPDRQVTNVLLAISGVAGELIEAIERV